HALALAGDLEVEEGGVIAGLVELAVELARLERDQGGRGLGAVDDGGDPTRTACGAGGPLSGPLPQLGGQAVDISHRWFLIDGNSAGLQGCPTPQRRQLIGDRRPADNHRRVERVDSRNSTFKAVVFCVGRLARFLSPFRVRRSSNNIGTQLALCKTKSAATVGLAERTCARSVPPAQRRFSRPDG